MKTWSLHPDEWYPVLQVNRYKEGPPDWAESAELSDEEIAELRALEVKFNEWQQKLAERFRVKSKYKEQFSLVYDWEESLQHQPE